MSEASMEVELNAARARSAELEAAEAQAKWHLNRLATIDSPLEKTLAGLWQQMRIAGLADSWGVYLVRGEELRMLSWPGQLRPDLDPSQNDAWRETVQIPFSVESQSLVAEAYRSIAPIAVDDILGEDGAAYPATRERFDRLKAFMGRQLPVHSSLAHPLRFGGAVVGILTVNREQVRPFSQEDIAAVQSYADQMALAIGNARMAEQLEERNRELAATLEQQQATTRVLEAIAASRHDERPVLQEITRPAATLLGAEIAMLCKLADSTLRFAAVERGSLLADIDLSIWMDCAFETATDDPHSRALERRSPVRYTSRPELGTGGVDPARVRLC
jgi:transcriptional regulator with GAF, ATPase, and Fis domain